MLEKKKIIISIVGNNTKLVSYLCEINDEEIKLKSTDNKTSKYLVLMISLDDDLPNFTSEIITQLQKSRENNQKVLLVFTLQSNQHREHLNHYLSVVTDLNKNNLNCRILVIYDLYSFNLKFPITDLDFFIQETIISSKIDISKNGQNKISPTAIISILPLLKKLLFLNSTQGNIYTFSGPSITDLDLAYSLKSSIEEKYKDQFDINSLLSAQQTPNLDQLSNKTSSQLDFNYQDTFDRDLASYINNYQKNNPKKSPLISAQKNKESLYSKIKSQISSLQKSQNSQDLRKSATKKIEYFFIKTTLIILTFFLLISLSFVISSLYSIKSLESAIFQLKKGNVASASLYYKKAKNSLVITNNNQTILQPILKIFGPETLETVTKVSNFLDYSSNTFESLLQTYGLSEKVYQSLNTPHNLDYQKTFLAIKANLQQEYESINQIEILLSDKKIPQPIINLVKKNDQYLYLEELKNSLWQTTKFVDIIPPLLGSKKPVSIILLVQNTSESRPTGGVIDYVCHLSIDNGRLVFLKIYTPQEIDSLSDFSLNSPPLLEKVTGDNIWHLREMNYNPDFPQTSVNISWYLEKKLKIKPDFIVAINTKIISSFLQNKDLLSQLNTKVDYSEYQSQLQTGVAADSTKELVNSIVISTLNHKFPLVDLYNTSSSNSQNVSLWSADDKVQSQLQDQIFAKKISDQTCLPAMASSRKCLEQTIHLNLSNFSSIPLDDYLDRQLKITSTPKVLNIDHQIELIVSYKKQTPLINRKLAEIVQLYLNKNSIIESITLNDTNIPLETVLSQTEDGLQRYQFLISTELNKTYNLKINYSTQLSEKTVLPIAYSYSLIPQNGVEYSKKEMIINLPESTKVSAVTKKVENSPNNITVDLTDKDSFGYNLISR